MKARRKASWQRAHKTRESAMKAAYLAVYIHPYWNCMRVFQGADGLWRVTIHDPNVETDGWGYRGDLVYYG